MASLKEIKTRIASVKNTLKITSAMKLVASAKLHKAQMALDAMMPYNERLSAMVNQLIQVDSSSTRQPVNLSTEKVSSSTRQLVNPSTELKHVAIITVSSNTSLCGGFNNNIIRLTEHVVKEYEERLGQGNVILFPIGRKVAQAFSPQSDSQQLTSNCIDIGDKPTYAEASSLSLHLMEMFLRGEIDKVELLYTHYKNMAVQELRREQFLPIEVDKIQVDKLTRNSAEWTSSTEKDSSPTHQLINSSTEKDSSSTCQLVNLSTILEPSAPELLHRLLPQALASRMYSMLLDSSAAEHAARTFAMQTATDNGDALLQELNLQYNKSRQQAITNELLDIMGGQMR